ncbi:hypothetical protein HD599_002481 [Conyzicola lurida]|uniref:Peptidase C3-like protein n=1 Tax=Conyzicola lurida TaxID=1172621 RepID=A0A841APB3_9MICO|nr:peptidase C39 family protein [Conyzicola lurida]MBB5844158.1 hypothetical protein [Conyzicola lurida]
MCTPIDDDLAAALAPDRLSLWTADRGPQPSTVYVERADGVPIAAVLATRRPATAATKIADVWLSDGAGAEAALAKLVDAVVDESLSRGDVAVKWQGVVASPERYGFTPLRTPYASAPGTEGVAGFVRWLRPVPHDEPPYYSQTSTFTCGAVTALLASEIRGSGGFGADAGNRDRELDFWRTASNYPTCEPVGLAVALRESLDDAAGTNPVEVFLDHDGPVLLESYTAAFDRSFRAELQANSLQKALGSDIAVRRERVSVAEIESRLRDGELALLLIDLEPMYGFTVPHWVLAHSAGDGVVVIDDPWISVNWGETWVDAHELPIATADLDRMLAWGDDGYRGVVFLRRP